MKSQATITNPSYFGLWALAWPVMLANAATPLLGLVDTAVIGHTGQVADMGALALGALAFNFLYWAFGFLRMGTTGFVARLSGAGDEDELHATVIRAVFLGVVLGLIMLVARQPISHLVLALLNASPEVEAGSHQYLLIRLLGAPASLATFALLGVLIGLGKTRELLAIQLFLNSWNVGLDLYFAYGLKWGIRGIATGTVIAEWMTLFFIIWRIAVVLHQRAPRTFVTIAWREIFAPHALAPLLKANSDILIRTLLMLASFGLFLNTAAGFGDTALAANHILMQFVTLSAYVLDGYAHATEPIVGHVLGANRPDLFHLCVKRSIRLAMGSAGLLAFFVLLSGRSIAMSMTMHNDVIALAQSYLPYAAAYILLSGLAFQLDGIFIGAGATHQMRNMALVASAAYLAAWFILVDRQGYAGLWIAFNVYVLARGLTLWLRVPSLTRRHTP